MGAGVPPELARLILEFRENELSYKSKDFKEQWTREQFVDPLLQLLGWQRGSVTDPAWDGYISEDRLVTVTSTRAPDYGCYYFGRRGFYVEAKAPSVRVITSKAEAFQIRSYGWSADVPLSILTDFEEVAVYDCRTQPTEGDDAEVARVRYFTYDEWEQNWQWFSDLFSRAAVENGSLLAWSQANKPQEPSIPVSRAFLRSVERWRSSLAEELITENPWLSVWDLSEATQLLLDRLIFLRIAEARGIEADRTLLGMAEQPQAYSRLLNLFGRAENRFNSSLFHFNHEKDRPGSPDTLTPRLKVDDGPLRQIVREFYPPASPYEFSAIPAEILGEVYEQFLGSQLSVTPAGRVKVDIKPEIKNAGGVVYTPSQVVHYMLTGSLGLMLANRTPEQVSATRKGTAPLRILDPACGSGSFLIQAYEFLLRWYLERYVDAEAKWSKGRNPRIARRQKGWSLTITERKRILRDHIFGTDIDNQAVEVTKLSLLLKALEGEDATTLGQQLQLVQDRALPDLSGNIKSGNALVEPNFMDLDSSIGIDETRTRAVNPFRFQDEFPQVFSGSDPGFDLVVGNPPYVLLQDAYRDTKLQEYYLQNYAVASYKLDLYHLFVERALQLVRSKGQVTLIVPSNFMTNNHLKTLRAALLAGGLRKISVVDSAVFARRSVDTAIFHCLGSSTKPEQIATVRLSESQVGLVESGAASIRLDTVKQSPEHLLVPSQDDVEAVLRTIEQACATTLGEVAHVNFGKQLRDRKRFREDVITVASEAKIKAPYKACYTGVDVERFKVTWGGLVCLDDPVAQRGGTWKSERQNATNKLLTKQIGKWPEWAIDTEGRQCLNTIFMVSLTSDEFTPHALLAILNSSTMRSYWVGRFWDQRRTFPKIKGTYLKRLPLPVPSPGELAQLDSAGTQLVKLHAADSDTNKRLRNELMTKTEVLVANMCGLDVQSHAALIGLMR